MSDPEDEIISIIEGEEDNPQAPVDGEKIDWNVVRDCAQEPETDIGNGRRFLRRYGDSAAMIEGLGWAVYDGKRWQQDFFSSHIRPLAHKTAELIRLEASLIEPTEDEQFAIDEAKEALKTYLALKKKGRKRTPEEESELLKLGEMVDAGRDANSAVRKRRARRSNYAKTSSNSGKIDNMLKEAAVYISNQVARFDSDPFAINVENGTIRLFKVGEKEKVIWNIRLDQHNKGDMISKLSPVTYDEKAECPIFLNFLETVQPNEEVRAFIQRYLGYSMTAKTREQVFSFFYGIGRNGKSTLVDLVCRILGDYATTIPFDTLAGEDRRKGSEATPDLVRVPGARLVRASEPESNAQWRESMVKSLTSSEPILIRRMREEFIEVYPTFKLIISGNHKPRIMNQDDGIWRRLLLVPWEVQIPEDKIDRGLSAKLWEERAGVLNWLLQGALAYLEQGLAIPDKVRAVTQEYREDSDPIGAFIKEACEITKDDYDSPSSGDLHNAFLVYCERAGLNAWGRTTFTRQFPLRCDTFGFRKAKTNGVPVYRGIRIKDEFKSPSGTRREDESVPDYR